MCGLSSQGSGGIFIELLTNTRISPGLLQGGISRQYIKLTLTFRFKSKSGTVFRVESGNGRLFVCVGGGGEGG